MKVKQVILVGHGSHSQQQEASEKTDECQAQQRKFPNGSFRKKKTKITKCNSIECEILKTIANS